MVFWRFAIIAKPALAISHHHVVDSFSIKASPAVSISTHICISTKYFIMGPVVAPVLQVACIISDSSTHPYIIHKVAFTHL